tara:strand:+ start:1430 stop:2431 length:1002 start_codon:yes stop_codon:yes gene_type:complete
LAFVDTLRISIKAGNGGNGKISFRREKYVAKGGPDGGDGGNGGDIIFKTSSKISTFMDLANKKVYKAGHGDDGKARKQSGKSGRHCIIEVPCGTIIYNQDTNEIIADLTKEKQKIILAKGGRGGKGNTHFSTPRIQTPRKATPGKLGETFNLNLELKVIADVGLIGYPNAGKSTLLKTMTQANPKIANYPFTTLHPNLGIFRRFDQEIVIADIPGIIEGAAEGVGLGNQFLRHISRTNILLFLIEPLVDDIEETNKTLMKLKYEIKKYDSRLLSEKKVIVAINKIDLLTKEQQLKLTDQFKNIEILQISCFLREGIEKLEQRIVEVINETNSH